VLHTIFDNKFATQNEIYVINERVDGIVAEAVQFAEESPFPDDSEVLKDIYTDKDYPFIVD
ncbi:MAG: pyruvate dehydrogenase (acetyl-transferring) E1 component subunit alpha, partial [Chitinophagaceae bacterium]|nr:pyruvate dehydrogenase (acetyl-transferring) E1 component subunit alpha [Chitinophagaceae bacterium]